MFILLCCIGIVIFVLLDLYYLFYLNKYLMKRFFIMVLAMFFFLLAGINV